MHFVPLRISAPTARARARRLAVLLLCCAPLACEGDPKDLGDLTDATGTSESATSTMSESSESSDATSDSGDTTGSSGDSGDTTSSSDPETGSTGDTTGDSGATTGEPAEPTPPETQGFYGATKTLDDSDGGVIPIELNVCAATADQIAQLPAVPPVAEMTCVLSSAEGLYTLPLDPGAYGLCVGDPGDPFPFTCDDCVLEIAADEAIRRDFEAGPGGGFFGVSPGDCPG